MRRLAVGLLVWSLAAGCGKSLVPGNAYDRPLLKPFGGRILPGGGLADTKNPMVALLWTDPFQKKPDVPMPASWMRSTMSPAPDATTADMFSAEVFRPPPPEALVDVTLPDSDPPDVARLAIAELVLVDDRDGDGTFAVTGPRADMMGTDLFLGGSAYLLTYVERPYASRAATPLTVEGQLGYQLVSYDCEGRISKGTIPAGPTGIDLIAQRSTSFPEVRNCRRTHSP